MKVRMTKTCRHWLLPEEGCDGGDEILISDAHCRVIIKRQQ